MLFCLPTTKSESPKQERVQWQFPIGTTIAANGYLIVWADEDSSQNTGNNFHTNFKLSSAGEEVILTDAAGKIADQVSFAKLTEDKVYARNPNGTGNFVIQNPTFNSNNNLSTASSLQILRKNIFVYPNPTTAQIGFTVINELSSKKYFKLKLINSRGQTVRLDTIDSMGHVDTSQLPPGLYIIQIDDILKKIIIN